MQHESPWSPRQSVHVEIGIRLEEKGPMVCAYERYGERDEVTAWNEPVGGASEQLDVEAEFADQLGVVGVVEFGGVCGQSFETGEPVAQSGDHGTDLNQVVPDAKGGRRNSHLVNIDPVL